MAKAKKSDTAAEPADKPVKEKKICKSEKVTGSLTRVRRTCMTQSEWARLSENTQKQVNDLSRDNNQNRGLGGS